MKRRLLSVLGLLLLLNGFCTAMGQTVTPFNRFVLTGTDDAEEATSNGAIDLTSSDLELMNDGTNGVTGQVIGIRFANINIPQGAIINSAYIQFTAKADKAPISGAITIKAEASDNTATFTSAAFNISTRLTTMQSVVWPGSTASTWSTNGNRTTDQQTPDLASLVQAITNRSGWASGNALSFILTGAGVRNAHSFNQSTTGYVPQLLINYTAPITYPANAFPVPLGGIWKYFDQGRLPAANWADSNYSDANWSIGTARLGYGDNPVTTVSYGSDASNKYITTYFRYLFNMSNTLLYDSLILRMMRDDGAVVYINGQEVFRSNMPAGTVGYSTLAASLVSGQDEFAYFSTVIKNNLVNGRNVIAVEVHQDAATSSDLAFDLQLFAKPMVLLPTVFPITQNSTWKYEDNGIDAGTTWMNTGYNDGSWQYGPGKLGYSDAPTTTLGYGPYSANKYITTYFRKQFLVAATTALADSIDLNLLRDDGAIVYINGVEAVRSNMPAGAINYRTFSSTIVDGADESTYFTYRLPKLVLVTGLNTIAVELHQRDSTSSDIGFDLELKEQGGAALSRGPYLQAGTPTSMVIRWRTDAATNSRVRWGTSPDNLNNVADSTALTTEHIVKISGLNPLTRYYYSIGSTAGILQGDTANYFATLPMPGSTSNLLRIGVIGDCGNNSTNQINVRNQLQNYLGSNYMNSWILLGDNAYSFGTDAEFQAEFFNIYRDRFLKQNPLYPTPGNHDYNNGSAIAQNDHNVPYYQNFTMPIDGEAGGVASHNPAYFSFDVGNIHFLSLDSYGKEDSATRLYDTLGKQVQWIKQDLTANKNKGWVIAYWHHPPFTKGSHNSDTEGELVSIRTNFIRILERMGVDMVLCGHSHDYERSKLQLGHYGTEDTYDPTIHSVNNSSGLYDGSVNACPYTKDSVRQMQGTVYVVSGSAGQLGGTTAGYPHNAMYYSNPNNGGSMILEVQGNRLDAKWICADGVIRDQFTMMKDVSRRKDTTINAGSSVTLTASYIGNYTWQPGGQTTRSITVTPQAGATTYMVKDNYDCVADTFTVNTVTILPLTWGNIRGWYEKNNAVNQLQWQTLSEKDVRHFELERSTDGINFTLLGKVNATGNSSSVQTYSFTDKTISASLPVYYYRIKQVDANGTYQYSPVVAVKTSGNAADIDVQVVPNPGRSSDMKIRLLNSTSLVANIRLTDASGRVIATSSIGLSATLQSFMPNVQPGVYFVTVTTESSIVTKQVVVK